MFIKPTQRGIWSLGVSGFILLAILYFWHSGDTSLDSLGQISGLSKLSEFKSEPGAGNSTLGFGGIYVLTENPSTWRVQGLLKAAKHTGVKVQVPVQKHATDEEVRAHVGGEPSEGYAHARALLSHLALLETIAQSEFQTALIVEDDVDFGVDIRAQMELLSKAFWDHAGPSESQTPEDEAQHPYREHEWDIFWPGHFGMSFVDSTDIFKYTDPYALPWDHLTTQFNNYYEQMAASSKPDSPQQQQLIFNVAPLATFAYATTKTHAARLAQKLRNDKAAKFDNAVHIDCIGGGHRCVAPVPQLFHHHQVKGERASSSESQQDDVVQDMSWYRTKHKYTYNIEWSARCNAAKVGEQLGDKWQCLPGKYDPMM